MTKEKNPLVPQPLDEGTGPPPPPPPPRPTKP